MIWFTRAISSSCTWTDSFCAASSRPAVRSRSACSRTSESGVFNSCEASAVKRRICSKDCSRRSNIWFSSRASCEISSFTFSTGMRSRRLSERMRLAVWLIARTGRSTIWLTP